MKATRQLTVFAVALLFAGQMFCQVPPSTAPHKPLDTVKNPGLSTSLPTAISSVAQVPPDIRIAHYRAALLDIQRGKKW